MGAGVDGDCASFKLSVSRIGSGWEREQAGEDRLRVCLSHRHIF